VAVRATDLEAVREVEAANLRYVQQALGS
jgi:hypothetical protein